MRVFNGRLRVAHLVIGVVLVGCGTTYGKPPLSDRQVATFASDYSGRLTSDPEFAGMILATAQDDTRNRRSGPGLAVKIDGPKWAALTRSQKARLLRKASVVLMELCLPYQPAHGSVCQVLFMDDLGTMLGFGLAGGVQPNGYRYELFGP